MTRPLIVVLPGAEHLGPGLARGLAAEIATLDCRHFPDGEVYLRYRSDPGGRAVVVVSPLDRPDGKILALLFAADAEAKQWGGEVAVLAGAPYVVLEKVRRGAREVQISIPDVERWAGSTPVLVDDIISSGETMKVTLGHLARAGLKPAVCIGVHAIFAGDAHAGLMRAGAARIVTTNTIAHASNGIDVIGLLATAIGALPGRAGPGAQQGERP